MKISFCTQAMNRTEHVRVTLKQNLKAVHDYERVEFILVDFNSTDGLEQYVKDELQEYIDRDILFYYKTDDPKYYHNSKAKNLSHRLSTGDVIVNMDADNLFCNDPYSESFSFWIIKMFLSYGNKIILNPIYQSSVGGRIITSSKTFYDLGGYDETFEAWGWEDADFYQRALLYGAIPYVIDEKFCCAYHHTNRIRLANYDPKVLETYNENVQSEQQRADIVDSYFLYTTQDMIKYFGTKNYDSYRRHIDERIIKVNPNGFQKYKVYKNFSTEGIVV